MWRWYGDASDFLHQACLTNGEELTPQEERTQWGRLRQRELWVEESLESSKLIIYTVFDLRSHSPGPALLFPKLSLPPWVLVNSIIGWEGAERDLSPAKPAMVSRPNHPKPLPSIPERLHTKGQTQPFTAPWVLLCFFPDCNYKFELNRCIIWKCFKTLLGTAFVLVVINPYLQSLLISV